MSAFNKSKFSSSNSSNSSNSSKKVVPIAARLPFCKVCKDAGKSEAEYTSHYVRENPDPSSKVVCPTLLALQCTYCDGSGHTVSYCKVLEKRKNDEAKFQRMEKMAEEKEKAKAKQVAPTKKITNAFASLYNDSDSDSEQVKVKNTKKPTTKKVIETKTKQETNTNTNTKMPGKVTEEDFPQLNPSAMKQTFEKKKQEVKSFGFAAIAKKVHEEEEQRKLEDEEAELTARLEEIKQEKKQSFAFRTPVALPSKTQAVAPAKAKEVQDVIKSSGVAKTTTSSFIPVPPVFTIQTKSLFEKPEYLQDLISESDEDEDEDEEPEYKPRMLVFDRAEIDDEDW